MATAVCDLHIPKGIGSDIMDLKKKQAVCFFFYWKACVLGMWFLPHPPLPLNLPVHISSSNQPLDLQAGLIGVCCCCCWVGWLCPFNCRRTKPAVPTKHRITTSVIFFSSSPFSLCLLSLVLLVQRQDWIFFFLCGFVRLWNLVCTAPWAEQTQVWCKH